MKKFIKTMYLYTQYFTEYVKIIIEETTVSKIAFSIFYENEDFEIETEYMYHFLT